MKEKLLKASKKMKRPFKQIMSSKGSFFYGLQRGINGYKSQMFTEGEGGPQRPSQTQTYSTKRAFYLFAAFPHTSLFEISSSATIVIVWPFFTPTSGLQRITWYFYCISSNGDRGVTLNQILSTWKVLGKSVCLWSLIEISFDLAWRATREK